MYQLRSPSVKVQALQEAEVRRQLYLEAERLRARAQKTLDRTIRFNRFKKYWDPQLPSDLRPLPVAWSAFNSEEKAPQNSLGDHRHEQFENALSMFLMEYSPDWNKIIGEGLRLRQRALRGSLSYTLCFVVTTQERMWRKSVPLANLPVSNFVSDNHFLRDLQIDPKDICRKHKQVYDAAFLKGLNILAP